MEWGWDHLRRYVKALFLVVIAVMAYLLADISNLFIASRLEANMALTQRPRLRKGIGVVPAADLGNYQSIVRNNLFDPTMGIYVPKAPMPMPVPVVLPPIPVPPPPPPVIVPKIPLNVQLVGTVIRLDSPSYAVIQDNRTRMQLIYKVGDYLLDDAKITKIERNRVVIDRENEQVVLEIALAPVSTPMGRTSPSAPPDHPMAMPHQPRRGRGVQNISEGQWIMDRSEIDYAVNNLPEVMTKARVVPNFVDGKSNGFRIFAIQEDSIYAKIGLQNGDILRRVNQIDVRDPQNFMQVFQQLKDESRITVDFVRNTEEKTFSYTIR